MNGRFVEPVDGSSLDIIDSLIQVLGLDLLEDSQRFDCNSVESIRWQ